MRTTFLLNWCFPCCSCLFNIYIFVVVVVVVKVVGGGGGVCVALFGMLSVCKFVSVSVFSMLFVCVVCVVCVCVFVCLFVAKEFEKMKQTINNCRMRISQLNY